MREAKHKRPHVTGFHLYEMSRLGKAIETALYRGWCGAEGKVGSDSERVGFLCADENVLKLTLVVYVNVLKATELYILSG